MISWVGLWFGSHVKNSKKMEQNDGEKVSMESSVSSGKVEEGTGRWCPVYRLFFHYCNILVVLDLWLTWFWFSHVTLTTLVMMTCYMMAKIWIVIFADILQIYVISRFWFKLSLLVIDKTHCISRFFFKWNNRFESAFCMFCQNVFVSCEALKKWKQVIKFSLHSPLSVVHVLKYTERIHKVVMLKYMY